MSFNLFRNHESVPEKPFKVRKPLAERKEEVIEIRLRFPNKFPVIVERYARETTLPMIDKTKFLVPYDTPMAKFLAFIRSRMHIGQTQSFYLIINDRTIPSMTKTIAEIYKENKDEDGFST